MSDIIQNTLPMAVEEVGALLERLGKDCHELQQIRELTQNAIEAILRQQKAEPGFKGHVVWDIDETYYEDQGVQKLCVMDDGDGMCREDLLKYTNRLSCSKGSLSVTANYGIGGKISAAFRNPYGVVYQSWKSGAGKAVWLHQAKMPKGHPPLYGLKEIEGSPVIELEDDARPDTVGFHGTKVTLLGREPSDDTTVPPKGTPYPSNWITRYLNLRYFRPHHPTHGHERTPLKLRRDVL